MLMYCDKYQTDLVCSCQACSKVIPILPVNYRRLWSCNFVKEPASTSKINRLYMEISMWSLVKKLYHDIYQCVSSLCVLPNIPCNPSCQKWFSIVYLMLSHLFNVMEYVSSHHIRSISPVAKTLTSQVLWAFLISNPCNVFNLNTA